MMRTYVVLDLEWNQSAEGRLHTEEGLPFEIIEIGAVKLDEQRRILSSFSCLVTPSVYPQLHFKISEVTHMDMEALRREGKPFVQAAEEFLEWCGTDAVFCTWGSMDLTELQRNMRYYGMKIPFSKPLLYYDVQKLYAIWQGDAKARVSLDRAVEDLGLLEERPFHRAMDDAFYTARVLQTLDFVRCRPYLSVDYFRLPGNREEEIFLEFPSYSKYVSRVFSTKEEAMEDKTVTDMICCSCRRMLRKKLKWFSLNQKQYFCLAWCPEHGYVRGKIRMKKAEPDGLYVVKTMKQVEESGADEVFARKEEQRKKRKVRRGSHQRR